MQIIKYILLILIFFLSAAIGIAVSKIFENRVKELREFRNNLNIMKNKIKFTYEPLKEIFCDIANESASAVEKIFEKISIKMENNQLKEVWENSIQEADISLNQEDKDIIKRLGKLLGQTDVDGQLSEIELTESFLDIQIQKAEEAKKKNQKLYKTLGIVMGLVFVIILI